MLHLSFHLQRSENIGTQTMYYNDWLFGMHLNVIYCITCTWRKKIYTLAKQGEG